MAADLRSLSAVPLFATVDAARLRRLAERSAVRSYAAGAAVVLHGQPGAHLLVLESGSLTAVRETAHGQRRRLGEFTAPCAVDKAAIFDHSGHSATWLASSRSRVRFVPAAELSVLIAEYPTVHAKVLGHLAGTLREYRAELVHASFADTTARVAAWISAAAADGAGTVHLPGAQQGLAEAVGATRVSVNRALRTLAGEGLLRIGKGSVEVRAPAGLAERGKAFGT
ncbi:Crp/Fnr family transcriptional regulator [Sciscionella marina]|uniref:Crp/Fnr family transcriptional regulator n=1 Tax=Sciscionella marina TaxID=508770 RepID=UPI00036EAB75|nr:Crp/Fnr family transcriptional regulator [Sciscionella marina]